MTFLLEIIMDNKVVYAKCNKYRYSSLNGEGKEIVEFLRHADINRFKNQSKKFLYEITKEEYENTLRKNIPNPPPKSIFNRMDKQRISGKNWWNLSIFKEKNRNRYITNDLWYQNKDSNNNQYEFN